MRKPPNEAVAKESPSRVREGLGEGLSVPPPAHDDKPSPGPSRKREGGEAPERTCILTRTGGARDDLVRLALSPDGEILPDVRAKAPGRGAWIGVDRTALEDAQRKGKLKGALSRAFKTGDIRIPDDLGDRIETALRQSALDRLGLEARAGTLLTGAEKIETACRKGEVHLLLHAADAGEDGNRKLDQAWRIGGGPSTSSGAGARQELVIPAERPTLSLALGRQNVVHIALIDRGAAARVGKALARWRAFIGPDSGLSAASAGTPDATHED